MWIALNYVSLKSWIQLGCFIWFAEAVVNCFELCIFEKLNTTVWVRHFASELLWIALNYVSLKSWIQQGRTAYIRLRVVNCFELCIFEKLNTTPSLIACVKALLWIALNYVSLKSWIQHHTMLMICQDSCELLWIMYLWKVEYNFNLHTCSKSLLWIALNYVSLKSWIQQYEEDKD